MRRFLFPLVLVACSSAAKGFDVPDAGGDSGKLLDSGTDVAPPLDSGEDSGPADAGPDTYKDPGSGRCRAANTYYSCPADASDVLGTFYVCTTVNGFICKQVERCQDFTPPCPYMRDCQFALPDGGYLRGTCE